MNEIVFPAAILRWPFFDPDADDAVNFGGIGAVIGHEIGHGFDDQGSRYDSDGNLSDWWTADDRANSDVLTLTIAQYGNTTPELDGHHVNGALTVGENIGDLDGITIAKAYLLSLQGEEPPVIDGLTGSQRVFLGWGQVAHGHPRGRADPPAGHRPPLAARVPGQRRAQPGRVPRRARRHRGRRHVARPAPTSASGSGVRRRLAAARASRALRVSDRR